jgi:hypothetical protein
MDPSSSQDGEFAQIAAVWAGTESLACCQMPLGTVATVSKNHAAPAAAAPEHDMGVQMRLSCSR